MLKIIRMAWLNLGRHRGRTILSLTAVICGVFVVILFKGFIDGMMDNLLSLNINLNSGHVRIIRPEYEIKERLLSLGYPIGESGKPYSELIKDIRGLPGVKQAMGRIRFGMMLVSGEEHEAVLGIGTEPAAEEQANHLSRYLRGKGLGRLPDPGKREVLLGIEILKKLHLKVGDKVNAIFTTSFGGFNIATFQIAGGMAGGLKILDDGFAYIPLDQAMKLLELDDMVTEIVVFGNSSKQTNLINTEIHRYLKTGQANLKVIPWNRFNEYIITMMNMNVVYNLIYCLMVILSSFVVFNTLMMVVSERTKEIGMLSALGMTPREIKQLFLSEGIMIALIGSLNGAILGGLCNWILSQTGIDMTRAMGAIPKEYTIFPILYPSYRLSVLFFSFGLGVVVTILAAYLPARRAALLKPTDALRTI